MPAPKRNRYYSRRKIPNAVRTKVSLFLTRDEVEQLQARAAAELRSISSYVSNLVTQHLKHPRRTRHRPTLANPLGRPSDRRSEYGVGVWLTIRHRKELEARAGDELRSVSNYITTLVLTDLRRAR